MKAGIQKRPDRCGDFPREAYTAGGMDAADKAGRRGFTETRGPAILVIRKRWKFDHGGKGERFV